MSCRNDDSFGPVVQRCRGDFDFTQKFERIFFWIVPAALIIPLAIVRISQLRGGPRLVDAPRLKWLKTTIIVVYAALQIALLALHCATDTLALSRLSTAGLVLSLATQPFLLVTSRWEHERSRRPSFLLNFYLALTLLLDIAHARTFWLSATSAVGGAVFARVFTTSVAVKLLLCCVEAWGKGRWTSPDGKDHSPEESSSAFSIATCSWLWPLFLRGYRKTLALSDIFALDHSLSAQTTTPRLLEKLQHQRQAKRKNALLWALISAFPSIFALPIGPRAALVGLRYAQAFLLQALLHNLEQPATQQTRNSGYGLIGACALTYGGMVMSTAYYGYWNNRIPAVARSSLCAAIYQASTGMDVSKASEAASLTLMSTDVAHIETGLLQMHQLWGGLAEVALGSWLLYTKLGLAFLVPFGLIIFCTAVLGWTMSFIGHRQTIWMEKIEERVAVTASAISDMNKLRILGAVERVGDLIQKLRANEIHAGNQFRKLVLVSIVLSYMSMSLSPAIAFAATSRDFNTSTLFVSVSFIMLFSSPLLSLFQALPVFFAALASFQRIDLYLSHQPRKEFRTLQHGIEGKSSINCSDKDNGFQGQCSATVSFHSEKLDGSLPSLISESAFSLKNASFGWDEGKMILQNLNLILPKGKFSIVFGSVASGKSTLCHGLLGEVPFATGEVNVNLSGSAIGYCAQTASLPSGTIKENIVGFSPFSQNRYDSVIAAAILTPDISQLSMSQDTNIAELSGGQKQRVALARALYLETDTTLFDDALSGLDMNTEASIFHNIFGPAGLVRQRGATAVYFTSSARHLAFADNIVRLDKSGILVSHEDGELPLDGGKTVSPIEANITIKTGSRQEGSIGTPTDKTVMGSADTGGSQSDCNTAEDEARTTGDFTIYMFYLHNTTVLLSALVIACSIFTGFCTNFSNVWLSYWAQDSFDQQNSFYLGIFGALRSSELLGIGGASAALLIGVVTSTGTNLHSRAIRTVMQAPLSFFTNTDAGTVTTLFSQDITIVDGELPVSMLNALLVLFDLLGNFFVIAVASPFIIISYPVLAAILYLIQMFYLRTSRQLRLLDLEAKAPLYSHFLNTINGLATIRAHKMEVQNISKYNKILNDSQRPAYFLAMIQLWLSTILLVLVGVVAVIITTLAVHLRTDSGFTGSSFVTLLTLSSAISELMQSYTLVETSIGAVNRLRAFSRNTKPENENDADAPVPEHWPANGDIYLAAVSASYCVKKGTERGTEALALKDLSITIQPGEKIGVCGRTGSGKSSLMMLLLRILDPLPSQSSVIQIGGIDLNRVNRTVVRQRIISIPQEPIFLPGSATIKDNLDYLGEAAVDDCISVLATTRLDEFVRESGGIDAVMNAQQLSSGQKQLFTLARALLRCRVGEKKNASGAGGLLLIDELNTRLDEETDSLIQDIVETEFSAYTVVMIAHNLGMVMNMCNRVLVLDRGELVEVGDPKTLVASEQSHFSKLYHSVIAEEAT